MSDYISLIREAVQALGGVVGPTVQESAKNVGVGEVRGWFHLEHALNIAPDPLTVERIRYRAAYNAAPAIQARLDGLAEGGWLKSDEKQGYHLTDTGRAAMVKILDDQREHLGRLQPLDANKLNRINTLLDRIIQASLQAEQPHTKHCLVDSSLAVLANDAPPLDCFLYQADCLTGFRDDTHIASWQPLGVDGHAWEIFSHIWEGKAVSLSTLPENLLRARGYTEDGDSAALQALVKRGWLEAINETDYRVTPAGKAVRDEAERQTDAYFNAPWSCLTQAELSELEGLLRELKQALEPALSQ